MPMENINSPWDAMGDFTGGGENNSQSDSYDSLTQNNHDKVIALATQLGTTPKDLHDRGLAAIKSGKISKKEAQAHFDNHITKNQPITMSDESNWGPPTLDKGLSPDATQDILPGEFNKENEGTTSKTGMKTSEKTSLDEQQAQEKYKIFAGLPSSTQNQEGINALKEQIGRLSMQPNNGGWIKPLTALTDTITGSDLMKGYTEPTKQTDIAKLQDMLARREAQIPVEFSKFLMASNTGNISQDQAYTDYMRSEEGRKVPFANPQDLMRYRQEQVNYRNIMNKVDKDPVIIGLQKPQLAIKAAMNLLNSGRTDTKMFNEVQVMLRPAVQAIGASRTGVGEREATYLNSAEKDINGIVQYISNNMQYLPKNDKMLQHLRSLASIGLQTIQSSYPARLKELTSGYEDMIDRNPEMKSGIASKLNAFAEGQGFGGTYAPGGIYTPSLLPPKSIIKKQKKSEGPTLESDLSKMNPKQLQEYIDTHK